MSNEEEFNFYAHIDKNPTESGYGHGYYQCFCKLHGNVHDLEDKNSFCYEFEIDKVYISMIKNSASVLVTILNIFLRFVTIKMIGMISFN